MNILLASDVSISNLIGGAERVLSEQCTRLIQKGHSVHILTRRLHGHVTTHENISGVKEWRYECNYKNQISFLYSNIRNGKLLFEKLHNKYHFDCINFHQPFSSLGVIQSALSIKIAKFYTCHSLSFEEFVSRNDTKNGLLNLPQYYLNIYIRKLIEKRILNKSDKITVLSQFTKEKLLDIYKISPKKVSIIHGGVDLKKFEPSENKFKIRKALGISDNKIVIFTVRNLVNRMGIENLILAFKNIVSSAPDIYLVIGGDGPLRTDLINLANTLGLKDSIQFTGFIPEEKLPSYYQMADLFVLPTRELEGFGLVTLEAMASGLPVLGTPVGGTKEIIGNFDSSFIFKGTDPYSIADLILENYNLIKQNPEKWNEISHRCRNFAERNYSWEKNIDALEDLFTKTLQN